jgi:hypothetical protein
MPSRPGRPRADAIVRPNEHVANVYRIIAICVATDELSINEGTPIPTPVVGAQWIGKGAGGRRKEGWRKRSRRSLREE